MHLFAQDELEPLDGSLNGARGSINIPVPWTTELLQVISQDIFLAADYLEISESLAPLGINGTFDAHISRVALGTTLFADVTNDFRPFVQLGYQSVGSSATFNAGGFSFKEKDVTESMLLVIGSEVDLTERMAFRTAIDCELEEQFKDSMLTAELIHWFGRYVFVRGGFVTDLQAEGFGAVAGGGVAW